MIVVAAVILAVGLVCAAAVARPRRRPDSLLAERLRDMVIITLKAGGAFRGLLFDMDDRTLVLREAVVLDDGNTATRVPVDGELLLARADVHYMQRAA